MTTTRFAVFAALYVVIFIGFMAVITGGVIDIAAWVSAPVILTAEGLVLSMIYMSAYHSEGEEHAARSHGLHLTNLDVPKMTKQYEKQNR